MLASPRENETQLQERQEKDHLKTFKKNGVNKDKYHSSTNHSTFSKLKLASQ